jgi:hypothetical protein
MKKIADFRRTLGVPANADLAALKSAYRGFMKEWHPDKFTHSDEERHAAEEKSKAFIEAYHFLVSIAPETRAAGAAEYAQTLGSSPVVDFHFEKGTLQIDFADGNRYEYLSVPKEVYQKLVNAPSPPRFIRRHIADTYVYRKLSAVEQE